MRRFLYSTKDYRVKSPSGNEFVFEGYGAIFGKRDRQNDVIERGAFSETIEENGGKFPLVADHELGDLQKRLGVAYAKSDRKGVRVTGYINTETQAGADAASDIRFSQKHAEPIGLSFGYDVTDSRFSSEGRKLKGLDVHEWSVTQVPAQPDATVTETKRCSGAQCRTVNPRMQKAFDRVEQAIEQFQKKC